MNDTYARERFNQLYSIVTNPYSVTYDSDTQKYTSPLGDHSSFAAGGGYRGANGEYNWFSLNFPKGGTSPIIWYNGQWIFGPEI